MEINFLVKSYAVALFLIPLFVSIKNCFVVHVWCTSTSHLLFRKPVSLPPLSSVPNSVTVGSFRRAFIGLQGYLSQVLKVGGQLCSLFFNTSRASCQALASSISLLYPSRSSLNTDRKENIFSFSSSLYHHSLCLSLRRPFHLFLLCVVQMHLFLSLRELDLVQVPALHYYSLLLSAQYCLQIFYTLPLLALYHRYPSFRDLSYCIDYSS